MLCQDCGDQDARVQLTDIVDGQKETQMLCDACAAAKGFVIDHEVISQAADEIQKIIAPLVPAVLENLKDAAAEAKGRTRIGRARSCPHCGITWGEFKKDSRFGCPHDYDVFGQEVDRMLRRIHGADAHQGRAPATVQARLERAQQLLALRGELESAVKAEDYELAARLRDGIRTLETGEDSRLGAL